MRAVKKVKNNTLSMKNPGNVRDTPYDTEFFHYFEQFLDSKIKEIIKGRG